VTAGFTSRFWALPKNSEQILAAIRYAAGGAFSVEFAGAPPTAVMELTEKRDGSERALHWVNYQLDSAVEPVEVALVVPEEKTVARVVLLSPDRGGEQPLRFKVERGRILFRMPRLETYSVAVVKFNP
jgi:hypothetical protein